ncbi:LPXTG cell wall anchor domain-containing protein [Blastococcus colisei]|uniref:LPXTG cell wall anchor domain-containing protein n=1 Tax=Blastococcus colisei TaxID=1564162 RepID=UPI00147681D6|nr:LPXTG cell wall anchor domain-containing protein [Blastococcus colisei]
MTYPAPTTDAVAAHGLPNGALGPAAPEGRGTTRSVASAYWRGRAEVRADSRSSAGIVLALALAGIPTGLLWWWLAPRADFRVTEAGPVPIGNPSPELLAADDAVLALILAGVGLLAGSAAWLLRRRRGVATVLALAVGACLTGVVAWQTGELLGGGPSEAELTDIGARVTTSLTLGSLPALALTPFTALLAYVAAVLYALDDGLGRTESDAGGRAASAGGGALLPDERPLVDAPPPASPST